MHGARRAEQRGAEHSEPSPALSNSDLEQQTRRAFSNALAGAALKQERTAFASAPALAAPRWARTAFSSAKAAPEARTSEQPFRAHCDLKFAQVAQAAQVAQVL